MSVTLILVGIGLVVLVVGGIALKSWLANRTITRATSNVAVSKANDEKRTEIVETLTKRQEDIKETVKKTDVVVETHRDKLATRKEALDARRNDG